MSFKLNESSQHDYCKKLVADILYKARRVENRSCAWIEYPICSVENNTVLDEYFFFDDLFWKSGKLSEDQIKREIEEVKDEKIKKQMIDALKALKPENRVEQLDKDQFVPTYQFCKDNGLNPVAVVDIACCWKGSIREIWEITKSNPLTKEKVKKIFNTLDDELLIYEIDVKDIMSISNIHDKPVKLYNDLVKKAKKWTIKMNDYEQWKESIFENHKKYGYEVNIDYMKKEYEWFEYLCGGSYGDDLFKAIFLYNKEHFDKLSFKVRKDSALCFECGNFYKDDIMGKSNTCEKCCENDDKPSLRANESEDPLVSYKEYIKYFTEIYEKFGYKVEGTFNSLWSSYFYNYPPPSNAELRKYPPCFNCGIPNWLNKCGSEYFCNKCLKE